MGLDVDLQGPVDGVLGRDRAESHEVGEQRARAEVLVDLVAIADLRVAVPVRGVGELEGDVGILVRAIQLRAVVEEISSQSRADEDRQKLAQDHVLVVPGGRPPRLLEHLLLADAVVAQPIDQPVVQVDERHHASG